MGYDVTRSRHSVSVRLSDVKQSLLSCFRSLNDEGQHRLIEYGDDLVSSGKYIKSGSDRLVEEA